MAEEGAPEVLSYVFAYPGGPMIHSPQHTPVSCASCAVEKYNHMWQVRFELTTLGL